MFSFPLPVQRSLQLSDTISVADRHPTHRLGMIQVHCGLHRHLTTLMWAMILDLQSLINSHASIAEDLAIYINDKFPDTRRMSIWIMAEMV